MADNYDNLRDILALIKETKELCFLEVKTAIGARDNLGRPTTTPRENKKLFMDYLRRHKSMKALILNSGLGKRMGVLTSDHPKCMTLISATDTILSRQLKQLVSFGIKEVVITTGFFDEILIEYCNSLDLPLEYKFVKNPDYATTNYIYSIYCAKDYLDSDIILIHGDLVFEDYVLDSMFNQNHSCMAVSSTIPLPQKDFKALIENNKITKVGIDFLTMLWLRNLYIYLHRKDWLIWLESIIGFCEEGKVNCYAEDALNEVAEKCEIYPFDFKNSLCGNRPPRRS